MVPALQEYPHSYWPLLVYVEIADASLYLGRLEYFEPLGRRDA